MYWTLELASYLEDAPWPATKDELIEKLLAHQLLQNKADLNTETLVKKYKN